MISFETAILSEPGGREVNEDACGYWNCDRHFCAVVADGAGGHQGGEVASRLAVKSLLHGFSEAPPSNTDELASLVRMTNQAVLDGRASSLELAQMHTTIVCLSIDLCLGTASWVHCGDSRLYWFRDGRLVERTRDHSLVQSLVDAGLLQKEEMVHHPKRSTLECALGLDESSLALALTDAPRPIAGANVFLLCSDGVWEHIPDAVLESLLGSSATPGDWLAGIRQAISESTRSVANHDNFSALAVWLSGEPT